jgi:hypothetical protein
LDDGQFLASEDQLDSRELVDAVLVHCGMRVIAVDSVQDALEALDECRRLR